MSPSAALGQEGLSDFPGLNDPDGLEEGWAVMQTVPSAGLSDVFLVISLGLWVWRGRPQRGSALLITSRQGCAVNMTLNQPVFRSMCSICRWTVFSIVVAVFQSLSV